MKKETSKTKKVVYKPKKGAVKIDDSKLNPYGKGGKTK